MTVQSPESRIYVGRLEGGFPVVYAVDGTGVERLHPAGETLEWGAEASDAASALARVLLSDAAGSQPPADTSRRFAREILMRLPRDGFALQRETVKTWLRRAVTLER